jgi:hypothetical protein
VDIVSNVESFTFADGTLGKTELTLLNPTVSTVSMKFVGEGAVNIALQGVSAPNVTVDLVKDGNVLATTQSSADGTYKFQGTLLAGASVDYLTIQATGKVSTASSVTQIGGR